MSAQPLTHDDELDASSARSAPRWRTYVGVFAFPTVLLTFAIAGSYAAVVAAAVNGVIPLWLGFAINAVLAYAAFTPAHEASHWNISGRRRGLRWLNELCGWLSMAMLLDCYVVLRAAHMQHHAHTNDPERDPDYFKPRSGPLAVVARSYAIFAGYLNSYREDARARGLRMRHHALVALWYAGLLGVGVTASLMGYTVEVLTLWVAPALAALFFLALVFDYVPHWPHEEQDRYRNTRILLFPGLSTLLLSQNYHLIHHLYPTIPFYRYGDTFREIREELVAHGAPIVGR